MRWCGYDPSWEAERICGAVGTPIETWEPESGVEHTDALKEWRARGASQPAQGGVPMNSGMPVGAVEPTIVEMSEEFVTEAMQELGDGCLEELSQEMM